MSSGDSLRNNIGRVLTPAFDDISSLCAGAFAKYEEELKRQRALLDIALKPQENQAKILLPQYHLTEQDRNPNVTLPKAEPPGSPEPE